MNINKLSSTFEEAFIDQAVCVTTKLATENKSGLGLIVFRGVLKDMDDHFLYLADPNNINTAVSWADVASVESLDIASEATAELMKEKEKQGLSG